MAQAAELSLSDVTQEDLFGPAVGVSGDTVVVGSPGRAAAFVFTSSRRMDRNGIRDREAGPGAAVGVQVFTAVDISGDTIVVGAYLDKVDTLRYGSAYVFVEPAGGWAGVVNERARLLAPSAPTGSLSLP